MATFIETESDLLDLLDPDARRRHLLRVADDLLSEVEELRLADRSLVPASLQAGISALQARLDREPPVAPATLRAAHNLVLAVQARLMSGNPRAIAARSHAGRGAGQPLVRRVRGASWKMLVLPPDGESACGLTWSEMIEATVERALHRWLYTHAQVRREAACGGKIAKRWGEMEAAWSNYWELKQEAARLLREPVPPQPR